MTWLRGHFDSRSSQKQRVHSSARRMARCTCARLSPSAGTGSPFRSAGAPVGRLRIRVAHRSHNLRCASEGGSAGT